MCIHIYIYILCICLRNICLMCVRETPASDRPRPSGSPTRMPRPEDPHFASSHHVNHVQAVFSLLSQRVGADLHVHEPL